MKPDLRSQNGYTLIEVIITAALAALLMSALSSVILTAVRAVDTATSRVEASSQIRGFEYFAYEDFADAGLPAAACTQASPCTTQPLVLTGIKASNSVAPSFSQYQVTYVWDGSSNLDRQIASTGSVIHAATGVSAFTWFVDTNATVVVNLTVTVGSYSESQAFRFRPQVNP